MPARALVLYPDPRLSLPAAPVETFGPDLAALAEDVRDTLIAVSALGLTACHLGILRRVVVARLRPEDAPKVYVNPEIVAASPETAAHDEGSVSMPGVRETILRPARVTLRYADLGGAPHEETAEGFAAAILQHEIDQLDGIFWIDRLSRLKRDRLRKRFSKIGTA
ncbi:peptide deformylase [Methylobacterium aerolatum]|uniref:Peptide deformylase-like n=1 Tax=Methylobacterium aerolatum TaxID=418708 RepID=A0ABU0I5I2_9HYPH|nr:peptide deformylase [Methylobacterium aerolatum]MDQ0449865.1 peptide deformylase [Methylobacterium aerolatum]GJD36632.1 Peptide deformylase [Methylobacterium aerolatum]